MIFLLWFNRKVCFMPCINDWPTDGDSLQRALRGCLPRLSLRWCHCNWTNHWGRRWAQCECQFRHHDRRRELSGDFLDRLSLSLFTNIANEVVWWPVAADDLAQDVIFFCMLWLTTGCNFLSEVFDWGRGLPLIHHEGPPRKRETVWLWCNRLGLMLSSSELCLCPGWYWLTDPAFRGRL